jgi:8-oxo-dGTP pyrophosphatase MutT (NUDIX family)
VSDRRSAVQRLLSEHSCLDAAERHAVDETLTLLRAVVDPFARSSLPGHITASAIVLDERAAHVLVVWHEGLGRWLQPGGHCDPADDSPLDTARRETAEETGVRLDPRGDDARLVHVDVHAIPARGEEPPHRHHDLRFAVRVPFASAAPLRTDARSGWVSVRALRSIGVDASLRRAVARARRDASASAGQADANAPN